jgi:hypothetical protein
VNSGGVGDRLHRRGVVAVRCEQAGGGFLDAATGV